MRKLRQLAIGGAVGFSCMALALVAIHAMQPAKVTAPPFVNVVCSPWEEGKRICDDGSIWIDGGALRHAAL